MRCLAVFCLALLLAACTNDGASFTTDGGRQILSVVRENNYFWEKEAKFYVTVSRFSDTRAPNCQRRHFMRIAGLKTHVELWQPGDNTFILRLGNSMYVVENRTCEGFARLEEDPPGGLGQHLGTFGEAKGVFVFVAEEQGQNQE